MRVLKFTVIMAIIAAFCGLVAYWPPLAAITLVAMAFILFGCMVWEMTK